MYEYTNDANYSLQLSDINSFFEIRLTYIIKKKSIQLTYFFYFWKPINELMN